MSNWPTTPNGAASGYLEQSRGNWTLFLKRLSDEFDRKRQELRTGDFAHLKDKPELVAELSSMDFETNRDPAMDAIRAYLANRKASGERAAR